MRSLSSLFLSHFYYVPWNGRIIGTRGCTFRDRYWLHCPLTCCQVLTGCKKEVDKQAKVQERIGEQGGKYKRQMLHYSKRWQWREDRHWCKYQRCKEGAKENCAVWLHMQGITGVWAKILEEDRWQGKFTIAGRVQEVMKSLLFNVRWKFKYWRLRNKQQLHICINFVISTCHSVT